METLSVFNLGVQFLSPQKTNLSYVKKYYEAATKSFKEHQKVNLTQFIENSYKALEEGDDGAAYLEELSKIFTIQSDIWINNFEKKDLENLNTLFLTICSVISEISIEYIPEDSDAIKKEIEEKKDLYNLLPKIAINKKEIETIKDLIKMGPKKWINHITKSHSSFKKYSNIMEEAICYDLNFLEEYIEKSSFQLIAEILVKNLHSRIESLYKINLNFDIENYIKKTIPSLVETLEGKKKIIQDIMQLKKALSLFTTKFTLNSENIRLEVKKLNM